MTAEEMERRVRDAERQRDIANQVAASSMRETLTEPLFDNGVAGPSLAELADVEYDRHTANFVIQYGIRDELMRLRAVEGVATAIHRDGGLTHDRARELRHVLGLE